MATTVSERVQKRRMALRAEGASDANLGARHPPPGFDEECRRQAAAVARADQSDSDMLDFLDAASSDLDDGVGG